MSIPLSRRLSEPHVKYRDTDERLERIETLLLQLLALNDKPQWLNQADYAKKFGVHRVTVSKRKKHLRRIGAVKGTGKLTLYCSAISPSGERVASATEDRI